MHGSAVEVHDSWLAEGVWDGPFEAGGFHQSEALFGSGLHVSDSEVVASASTALVDRLFYAIEGDRLRVSNSLVVTLGATGHRIALRHDYRLECSASLQGLFRQPYPFTVAAGPDGPILQCFHNNLVISAAGVQLRARTREQHFASFDEYAGALRTTLRAVNANARSPMRRFAVGAAVTLSSGYDSVAVSCLARELGVRDCYTTQPDRSSKTWVALEDGAAIARTLGMDVHLLIPPSSSTTAHEQWFIAPTVWGSELIFHDMAAQIAASGSLAAVYTGYHGDKVWDANSAEHYLRDDILRGDTSGLNLSEARLVSGFFNVAVPFIHARGIRSLQAISNSAEMAPWRVGGDYDRPIPRRLAEVAGVPRHLFGQRKRVVMSYYQKPFNPELQRRFSAWLARELRIGPTRVAASELLSGMYWKLGRRLTPADRLDEVMLGVKRLPLRGHDLRQAMFKWAANDLADGVAGVLQVSPHVS